MIPRQTQQKQNQQQMQHEVWNIPEIVQNKAFGGGTNFHKKELIMRREQNNYEVCPIKILILDVLHIIKRNFHHQRQSKHQVFLFVSAGWSGDATSICISRSLCVYILGT